MMKTLIAATLTLGFGLFAMIPQENSGIGTDSNDENAARRFTTGGQLPTGGPFTESGGGTGSQQQEELRAIQAAIATATRKLKAAESKSERGEAREELKQALAEDYNFRLDGYEAYLDGLEKKLAVMRLKLKRRRDAGDEIIDLRIKVLDAEINDLGWPTIFPGKSRNPFSTFIPKSTKLLSLSADSFVPLPADTFVPLPAGGSFRSNTGVGK